MFLTLIICAVSLFTFTACDGEIPPGIAWASKDILTYEVKDGDQDAGELQITTQRIYDEEDKYLDENLYEDADQRITMTYTFGDEQMLVESLMSGMSPVATLKTVDTSQKNYTLSSYFSDNYYYYTLKENGIETSDRIKAKGDFIDNDIMYIYLRCFDLDSGFTKLLNIPDPFNNDTQSLTARRIGTKELTVPYPDKDKVVETIAISIERNSTPVGESIYVYYTPEDDEYNITGSLGSLDDSKKFPVKIVENNLTFNLIEITVV